MDAGGSECEAYARDGVGVGWMKGGVNVRRR